MMQASKKRRRRYAAPIGGVFVALALIGILTVIFFSIDLTGKVLDNTPEKQKLEKLLLPVVMFDPVPFESPADLEMQQILLYSMWHSLSEHRDTYSYNDNAELVVSASDLDVAAAKLFGPDIVLEHQTFNDNQTTYYFDGDTRYFVPTTAQLYVYTPSVEEITQAEKGVYHVTVGYVPPQGNAWTMDFSGNKVEPAPDKSMIYVMQKVKGDYYILALRDPPNQTTAATLENAK